MESGGLESTATVGDGEKARCGVWAEMTFCVLVNSLGVCADMYRTC